MSSPAHNAAGGSNEFHFSHVPKSHWTLINEFHQIPEQEIELFIPQICNIILDREALNDQNIFEYFEKILVKKCADCFPFGVKVANYLKV